MSRPTFYEIYMNLARDIARRSTCSRLQVGSVITSTDFRKVIAIGYNGNAEGLPNKCDSSEPGKCGCIHSEINSVTNCDSPRGTEKIFFITHLPCKMCAKSIINLGNVKEVWYDQDYRTRDSLEIFREAGIPVYKLVEKQND